MGWVIHHAMGVARFALTIAAAGLQGTQGYGLSISMGSRKKIPKSTEAEVLVQCRRRCCACFGLNQDAELKKGQIAHLDGNPANNEIENLAFLCLDHHDAYDSRTSQSKGLVRVEIERYREELIRRFSNWSPHSRRDELLNFLAFNIDLDAMATAAIKVGNSVVHYGEQLAFEVLVTDAVDYSDGDLYVPYLMVLDYFASWGWLTYTEREAEVGDEVRVFIKAKRKPVCNDVAAHILKKLRDRGESAEFLLSFAGDRGWNES